MSVKAGSIVTYHHPGDKTGKYPPKTSPAMILHLHPDGSADLRVFTSPTWSADGTTVISGGGQIENYKCVEGTDPFQWSED